MRSGQQNKRGRGRNNGNNNGRKGANPLTRTYDSTGPDVKVRGTAQNIADKYAQLARDAQSSGDRVMAENYLQHAEHYNRIIAAAQAQMQERYQRDDRSDNSDDNDNSDGSDDSNRNSSDTSADNVSDGSGPQPVIEGVPAEVALENEEQQQKGSERPRRQQRQRRPRRQQNSAEGEGNQDENSSPKDGSSDEPALAEAGE